MWTSRMLRMLLTSLLDIPLMARMALRWPLLSEGSPVSPAGHQCPCSHPSHSPASRPEPQRPAAAAARSPPMSSSSMAARPPEGTPAPATSGLYLAVPPGISSTCSGGDQLLLPLSLSKNHLPQEAFPSRKPAPPAGYKTFPMGRCIPLPDYCEPSVDYKPQEGERRPAPSCTSLHTGT